MAIAPFTATLTIVAWIAEICKRVSDTITAKDKSEFHFSRSKTQQRMEERAINQLFNPFISNIRCCLALVLVSQKDSPTDLKYTQTINMR
jgi:hypothetical protein